MYIVHAEQLFDMELTDYTEFNLIKQEFDYLKLVGWMDGWMDTF